MADAVLDCRIIVARALKGTHSGEYLDRELYELEHKFYAAADAFVAERKRSKKRRGAKK